MKDYQTEGLILYSKDIKEFDRLYTIFSKDLGKKIIKAVGVRKPTAKLAHGMEPLTHANIFLIKCRYFDKVTGTITENHFPALKKNLSRIFGAKKVFFILEKLLGEEDAHKEIFLGLKFFLEKLDQLENTEENAIKIEILKWAIIWKTLSCSGFKSEFYACSNCNEKFNTDQLIYFMAPAGLICKKCLKDKNQTAQICRKAVIISPNVIKALRVFIGFDWQIISKIILSKEHLRSINQLTRLMLEEVLGQRVEI